MKTRRALDFSTFQRTTTHPMQFLAMSAMAKTANHGRALALARAGSDDG